MPRNRLFDNRIALMCAAPDATLTSAAVWRLRGTWHRVGL